MRAGEFSSSRGGNRCIHLESGGKTQRDVFQGWRSTGGDALWAPGNKLKGHCCARKALRGLGVMQAMEKVRMGNGGDSKVNGIDHSFATSNGSECADHFIYVPHPEEPSDVEKPVQCPPPEPCIMHDGRIFKDKLANSRRRSDLLGSMRENDHIKYYSTPKARHQRGSKDTLQAPALIAPDLVATKIVN